MGLYTYNEYWEVYAITVYVTCGLLLVAIGLMASQICRKRLICLTTLLISATLQSSIKILEVAVLKKNTKVLAIVTVFRQALANTTPCVMITRYLMVYKGNPYVMVGKEIPPSVSQTVFRVFYSMLSINWLVLLGLGVLLFKSDTNIFDIVSCKQ